ncbi:MAG: isoprenylcysteine carboxylmethyltransferase family protein [Candidatus Lokiarchaeota archaeon]|nr:isoprenylcysteine carboxylmethyltransferase family protein [Candidatus Lokiarchaeota archaeon]
MVNTIVEILALLNFLFLNISAILSFIIYTLSVRPASREKRIGQRAYKEGKILRVVSDILWLMLLINLFLWKFVPISELNWKIITDDSLAVVISIIIAIPFVIIIFKSIMVAGKETIKPSEETKLYGGIYKHIRHPQIAGSIPLFIIICLGINSLFLLIWFSVLMVLIIPIVIYYEEKDLILRFGDEYINYKKRTGAIFPKFKRKKPR